MLGWASLGIIRLASIQKRRPDGALSAPGLFFLDSKEVAAPARRVDPRIRTHLAAGPPPGSCARNVPGRPMTRQYGVLIVEDDAVVSAAMRRAISEIASVGFVDAAFSLGETRALLGTRSYGVVLLDPGLPDGDGLELLPLVRDIARAPEVIVVTGAAPEGAELALRQGAWDYLSKPFSQQELQLGVERALTYHAEKGEKSQSSPSISGMVGTSGALRQSVQELQKAAASQVPVLITGETGSGKELAALAVHTYSDRAKNPFIVADCGSLTESLAESTLFGHRKGAFTGADRDRIGLINEAHTGTLVLDEIGELPLSMQKAFLRVLQEKRFRPVGAQGEVSSDFRLVALTNRDLDAMVEQGQFRADLLHRIRGLHISLPPLRERKDDIPQLFAHHLQTLAAERGREPPELTEEVLEALSRYDWPGNIRELVQAAGACLANADSKSVHMIHLPLHIRVFLNKKKTTVKADAAVLPTLSSYRRTTMKEVERAYFVDLARCAGTVAEACAISGLGRARLYELLKAHGVSLGDIPEGPKKK